MATTDGVHFDTGALARLNVELGRVPGKAVGAIDAASAKGALNIKNQMAAEASGHAMFPAFPASITYDRRPTFGSIAYEVGPDKTKRQGALGNILYFGTSRNAPVLNLLGPLEAETPNYVAAVLAAATGAFT